MDYAYSLQPFSYGTCPEVRCCYVHKDMLYLSCKTVHMGRCDRGSTFKFRHYSKVICSIFEKYVYDGTSLILYLSTTAFVTSESGKTVSGEIGSSSIQ